MGTLYLRTCDTVQPYHLHGDTACVNLFKHTTSASPNVKENTNHNPPKNTTVSNCLGHVVHKCVNMGDANKLTVDMKSNSWCSCICSALLSAEHWSRLTEAQGHQVTRIHSSSQNHNAWRN